jgi:hypothetical protein
MNWRVSDFNQIMMMMMKVNDDDGMVFQGPGFTPPYRYENEGPINILQWPLIFL